MAWIKLVAVAEVRHEMIWVSLEGGANEIGCRDCEREREGSRSSHGFYLEHRKKGIVIPESGRPRVDLLGRQNGSSILDLTSESQQEDSGSVLTSRTTVGKSPHLSESPSLHRLKGDNNSATCFRGVSQGSESCGDVQNIWHSPGLSK